MRYITKKAQDLRYISQIFEKDKRDIFTDDAYLRQDILRYCLDIKTKDVKPYKLRDLQRWVVQNNKEIKGYYSDKDSSKHTTISWRIHGFERRINRAFEDLIQMRLIKQISFGPAEKIKDKQVELYVFTKHGELLALVIHSMKLKDELSVKKENTKTQMKIKELAMNNQNLYDLMIFMLAEGENFTYEATLWKKYLLKLHSKRIFDKFVDNLLLVCNSNNNIVGIMSLVGYVFEYMLNQAPDRNLFIDLWYDSANELDPKGRNIFLYRRKLDIEENFRNNNIKGYSKEYERYSFDYRANPNKIILEGECRNCKKFSIIVISHSEYKSLIRDFGSWGIKIGSVRKFDCKHCQSKNSCSLSVWPC